MKLLNFKKCFMVLQIIAFILSLSALIVVGAVAKANNKFIQDKEKEFSNSPDLNL